MASEPLPGVTPEQWRGMLGERASDAELAATLADAWNECGWLGHDLGDDDCTQEMRFEYDAWCALEEELVAEVARRMNLKCEPPYVKLIAPFMERNGYRDGCGWWIKKGD